MAVRTGNGGSQKKKWEPHNTGFYLLVIWFFKLFRIYIRYCVGMSSCYDITQGCVSR
jgi:hypothetical protein